MFEVLWQLVAMILVGASAAAGSVIAFFTKLEMELYKAWINRFRILAGFLLVAMILISAFKPSFIAAFLAGIVLSLIIFQKDGTMFSWLVLGTVLGSAFAYSQVNAFLISAVFVVYNFLYATVLDIPGILQNKRFFKDRAFKSVFFVLCCITAFALLFKQDSFISGSIMFIAAGAFIGMLGKQIFTVFS